MFPRVLSETGRVSVLVKVREESLVVEGIAKQAMHDDGSIFVLKKTNRAVEEWGLPDEL